jgi:hypothetical protein
MAGEKVVLEEVLKQHQAGRAPNLSASDFFEVFSVDQIMKDFDLSYENILDAILDGPNDGVELGRGTIGPVVVLRQET